MVYKLMRPVLLAGVKEILFHWGSRVQLKDLRYRPDFSILERKSAGFYCIANHIPCKEKKYVSIYW